MNNSKELPRQEVIDAAIRLLEKIEEAGMGFAIMNSEFAEGMEVSARDLVLLAVDSNEAWAEIFGMTREVFAQWRAWKAEGFRCQGSTRRGRCRKASAGLLDTDPEDFIPGISTLCEYHRPRGDSQAADNA